MGVLLRVVINGAAVWAAIRLVDGLQFSGDWPALLVIAIVMAAVNAFVRPLATLFSLPLVVLTLGLFILMINALMLSLVLWASGQLDLGLTSDSFSSTFLGALIISIVSWVLTALFGPDD